MSDIVTWLLLGVATLAWEAVWLERLAARFPMLRGIVGGWTYFFLGLALGPHVSNTVSLDALPSAGAVLMFLLAWCGGFVGLQLKSRLSRAIPARLWRWIAFDAALSILIGTVAAPALSRAWPAGSDPAGQVLLGGTIAALAMGWSPATRAFVRVDATDAPEIGAWIRTGAGLLSVLAIITASLPAQAIHVTLEGAVVDAQAFGVLAFSIQCATIVLVALASIAILGDATTDDARSVVVGIGALSLVGAASAACGGSPLLTGLLFGATVAQSRRRVAPLGGFVAHGESAVSAALLLFAGLAARLPDSPEAIAALVGAGVLLAAARATLKPLAMLVALGRVEGAPRVSRAAILAPIPQSPLALVILLAFTLLDHSGLAPTLISLCAVTALASIGLVSLGRLRGAPA